MPGESIETHQLQRILESWYAAKDAGAALDLDHLCGHDASLVRRVRALIEGEEAASGALESLPGAPTESGLPLMELGGFRLRALLGAGGMGRVFLAEQVSLGRLVALKVLNPEALGDATRRRRFRREAEIAAALDHPNIVPVYGVGEDQGHAFIAMKWLSGPGLDALPEPLSPQETARVGVAVALALEEAHLSGVIHRDVKPANVILDGETPYLVDFGLARAETDGSLTREGSLPGTLAFMPPERLRGNGSSVAAHGDIYALGATLYAALSGQLPFDAHEPARLIQQILFREPPPLKLPPRHRDLGTIILRALEKEPGRRFPSAAAMARDLKRYQKGEPIRSRPAGPMTRTIKLVRRHRREALVGALALLVMLVLLGILLFKLREENLTFQARLQQTRTALQSRQLETARNLIRALKLERPKAPAVQALQRAYRGRLAVERLLDMIKDRPEAQNPGEIKRLEHDLRQTGGLLADPWHGGLALSVAELNLRHLGRAQELLSGLEQHFGPHLCLVALSAVAHGKQSWRWQGPPPAEAEEHLFVALAQRLAQKPLAREKQEIERAMRLDPGGYRAKYALAGILDREGRYGEARALILGLDRPGIRRTPLLQSLGRLDVLLGRFQEAEQSFKAIPAAERSLACTHQWLLLRYREGHHQEVEEALRHLPASWQVAPEILLLSSWIARRHGRKKEAHKLLEEVVSKSFWEFYRDKARADLLLLEVESLPGHQLLGASPSTPQQAARTRALQKKVKEVLTEVQDPHARSACLQLLWRLLQRMGERKAALSALSKSLQADPENPAALVDQAQWAVQEVLQGLGQPLGKTRPASSSVAGLQGLRTWGNLAPLILKGRAAAEKVIALEGRGLTPPTPRQVEEALLAKAYLARLLQDWSAAAQAAREARRRMRQRGMLNAYERAWLKNLDRILEQCRRHQEG